ncbi:antibiotic biosynthesis monooxygenase [Burkholderia sp. WAC0059]|uniref:putative quinol monooxygenase n=1 Tax=Burkholderia sp. WAC0059 TaxID=2066022 RepID=UPI000C7EA77C|nr:antibiotic biosynthesis monooxygenase [Burkholderia sp. WAC0059]PLZ00750.1 antibiotic biosynthesis monooxygenase [Burkholderia sp. WAC0059]
MFVVVVNFSIHESHVEDFEQAVVQNAGDSLRLEDDCFVFDVCRADTGKDFFLYEVYRDAAAFERHLRAPHFLTFSEMTRHWVHSKDVRLLTLIDPPHQAARGNRPRP